MALRGTVKFPAYRRYRKAAVSANDAMMALLISSRLAAHALQLHEGSTVLLPDLYPGVDDVRRLNRSVEDAERLIRDAERHHAYMAIPYVLSIHQDFVSDALRMLRQDGLFSSNLEPGLIRLEEVHDRFSAAVGSPLPEKELELFEFVRMLRNRILHHGATTGSHVRTAYRQLSKSALQEWEDLSRPFAMTADDEQLQQEADELIATLAVSKRLARAVNRELQRSLSRLAWLDLIVEDFVETSSQGWGQEQGRARRISNFARHNYAKLEIKKEEVRNFLTGRQAPTPRGK